MHYLFRGWHILAKITNRGLIKLQTRLVDDLAEYSVLRKTILAFILRFAPSHRKEQARTCTILLFTLT